MYLGVRSDVLAYIHLGNVHDETKGGVPLRPFFEDILFFN